jgi:hypothetical protein
MYKINTLLFFCFVSFLTCKKDDTSTLVSTPLPFDQAVESESILAVLDNERSCFYARDYECWRAHYVHEDYAFQAWNRADGTFDAKVGWGELDGTAGKYIKEHPQPPGQGDPPKIVRQFMKVKFFNNVLAYVMWHQYNPDPEAKMYTHSLETRIMEKVGQSWKISNMTSFYDYVKSIPVDSLNQ